MQAHFERVALHEGRDRLCQCLVDRLTVGDFRHGGGIKVGVLRNTVGD